MTSEKQNFYEQLAPAAMEQQIKYGIPASVTLAQAWIEHGNYSKTTYNYFGIHDDDHYWRNHGGKTVELNDNGKMAHFRIYESPEQGIEDHSRFFFRKNSRYSAAHSLDSTDHKGWATVICRAGYAERPASDPDRYLRRIEEEIKDYNLDRFDQEAVGLAAKRGQNIGYMRSQTGSPMMPSAGNYYAQNSNSQEAVSQSPSYVASSYCLPIQGGDLVMSSGFGHRHAPTAGASSMHKGIDLPVERGTAVVSTETGMVVAVKTNMTEHDSSSFRSANGNTGGNYVIVEYPRANGESYRVSYCHLTENGVAVKPGQMVQAGTVLGYAGSTGASTGPHLHLTVKKGKDGVYGQAIDPLGYLAEISARGNLQETIHKKGSNEDLLASLKSQADLTPTPADQMLYAQNSQGGMQQGLNQGVTAEDLLREFGQNQDTMQMLSYMMQQQNLQGSPGSFLDEIVSTLFKGALMLAMNLHGGDESEEVSNGLSQSQDVSPEQHEIELIQRKRDTPDVAKVRQLVAMSFDADCPEQQLSNGVRLA